MVPFAGETKTEAQFDASENCDGYLWFICEDLECVRESLRDLLFGIRKNRGKSDSLMKLYQAYALLGEARKEFWAACLKEDGVQ